MLRLRSRLFSTTPTTSSKTKKFLITGGLGQIGVDLADVLASKHGKHNVVLSDIKPELPNHLKQKGFAYEILDVTNKQQFADVVAKHQPTCLVHFR